MKIVEDTLRKKGRTGHQPYTEKELPEISQNQQLSYMGRALSMPRIAVDLRHKILHSVL